MNLNINTATAETVQTESYQAVASASNCSRLRVGKSPISNHIFAGKCAKDGLTWKAGKEDVTGDVLQAIIDYVTPGHEVNVTVDGVLKYRIRVTEISPQNDQANPATDGGTGGAQPKGTK